jgi:hypothetical protein
MGGAARLSEEAKWFFVTRVSRFVSRVFHSSSIGGVQRRLWLSDTGEGPAGGTVPKSLSVAFDMGGDVSLYVECSKRQKKKSLAQKKQFIHSTAKSTQHKLAPREFSEHRVSNVRCSTSCKKGKSGNTGFIFKA